MSASRVTGGGMMLPIYDPPERAALWSLHSHGQQRVPPGRPYWWDNRDRQPRGTVVVQATEEGQVELHDSQGRHVAGPGSVMLFVFGEATAYGRRNPSEPSYACRWVNLLGAGLVEHIDALRRRHGPVLRWPWTERVIAAMKELVATADPGSSRYVGDVVASASAVHAFIIRLFELSQQSLRQDSRPADWAVDQMLRQPVRPWSLKEYAERYGVSREHLSRVFRARTGHPPHQWLARRRLDAALRLLRETDLPVVQVARQSGFSGPHHLARCVRAATGLSPTSLRPGHPSRTTASPRRGKAPIPAAGPAPDDTPPSEADTGPPRPRCADPS